MTVQNFRINVIARVALLVIAMVFLKYAYTEQSTWLMTNGFSLVAVVLLAIELIRYVEKTNRDLQGFLLAIKHKDFTHTFTQSRKGKSFAGLQGAFNQIIFSFQDLRAEKESHYLYLQTVIEHVQVALLCINDEGEVVLMNRAAQELLDKPYLSKIENLERIHPQLLTSIQRLKTGERELIKIITKSELSQVSILATEFKLQQQSYKLVSLQNIKSELDEKELDTWQKLIRVLTHEIMNSVTPIVSLTKVLVKMLTDGQNQARDFSQVTEDQSEDIVSSLQTIETRSKGLLHFVHAYRTLTKVPPPKFRSVYVAELLNRIRTLLSPEFDQRSIQLLTELPPEDLTIQADPELLEQVLINLVKNGMEALEGRPDAELTLTAGISADDRVHIQVIDNGPGIDDEFSDKIFIPFFTTKKIGSGIGLSLSRQIMRLHRGSINFRSEPGEGTVFTLVF